MKFQSAYDNTPDFINTGYAADPIILKSQSIPSDKVGAAYVKWGNILGQLANQHDILDYIQSLVANTQIQGNFRFTTPQQYEERDTSKNYLYFITDDGES